MPENATNLRNLFNFKASKFKKPNLYLKHRCGVNIPNSDYLELDGSNFIFYW